MKIALLQKNSGRVYEFNKNIADILLTNPEKWIPADIELPKVIKEVDYKEPLKVDLDGFVDNIPNSIITDKDFDKATSNLVESVNKSIVDKYIKEQNEIKETIQSSNANEPKKRGRKPKN